MTGVIINNNFYDISTGSNKIEYSSMNGESVGYSMYGDEVPYTEIQGEKELEWIQTGYPCFTYCNNFSTNIHYKWKFKWVDNSSSCNYNVLNLSSSSWGSFNFSANHSYFFFTATYNNKQYSCMYKNQSFNTIKIPFNTEVTFGFLGGKCYSDINQSYGQDTTSIIISEIFPVNLNIKPDHSVYSDGTALRLYYIQEDDIVYKFFYDTKEDKFYVKRNDEIINYIDNNYVVDYKIKES